MKRVILAGTIALMTVMLAACGSADSAGEAASLSSLVEKIPDDDPTRQAYLDQTDESEATETQDARDAVSEADTADQGDDATTEADIEETDEADASDAAVDGFSFADLNGIEFYFSSGAGAWATSLNVESDGSFSGIYRDDDMGDTGDDHLHGTAYYCAYSGKFTQPQKVDDYTYVVQIQEISYENEEGTQEIKDEILYNYTYPYGLEEAGDIYIYLPGKSTQGFSELLASWVRSGIDTETGILTEYAISNVAKDEAFVGYSE